MNYLAKEVGILQETKRKLEGEEKLALALTLEAYNKLYLLALKQQQYIKKKRPEYAEQMEQNFKLIERNKFLEDSIKRYKELNKSQIQYSKELEKELRMTKKLLENYQKNSNS